MAGRITRWLRGAGHFPAKGRTETTDEAAELTLLLLKVSESADGTSDHKLLNELISIDSRPGVGGSTGSLPLKFLRQFPGNQQIAQAAANDMLDHARTDPAFSAAFADWLRRDRVRGLIASVASAPPRGGAVSRIRWPRWTRRTAAFVTAAVLLAVGGSITAAVENGISSGTKSVGKALGVVHDPTGKTLSYSSPLGNDGMAVDLTVEQGLGCPPSYGDVYPSSVTPGLSSSAQPGTGPTHDGKTWDEDPSAFSAVPASPVAILLYITGPENHAVTLTGLAFHVVSRKDQVEGVWLNSSEGCGAGGEYHYGVVDLNAPPPYWQPVKNLPPDVRADALKFPYIATANDPQSLWVTVQMEDCDCTWYAVLSWVDEGASKSMRIEDNGHPFETTSVTGMGGPPVDGGMP